MSEAIYPAPAVNPDPWEAAYLRFETPQQEIRKFQNRLRRLGATHWPRDSRIVELFCGRGNGLHALIGLGFCNLTGVDLSPRLAAEYSGSATVTVADCRQLPFAEASIDAVIVQGGLHHLPQLPADLEQVFREIHRVLRPTGKVLFVEPWLTPFLRFVHAAAANQAVRRLSPKLDALQTMIEHERPTYENWLSRPKEISALANHYFLSEHESFSRGKWNFVGRNRP